MSRVIRVGGLVGLVVTVCLAPSAGAGEWQWGRVTALKAAEVVAFEGSGADYDVRLLGVDAPEPGQPFADEAQRFLQGRLLGETVRLRVSHRNAQGELVARVLWGPDGGQVDVGLELVRAGLAWREPAVRYKPLRKGEPDELSAAEQQAREQRAGLWSASQPEAPWDYRARQGAVTAARQEPRAADAARIPTQADLTPGVDRNLSQRSADDNECAISKSPVNANQLFELCNVTGAAGMFAARSTDGGVTWIYPDPVDKTIADGDPGQGPDSCCDPTLAWDQFGNLFITYIGASLNTIETIFSTNGGSTFTNLATFSGSVDQPTVVEATVTGGNTNVWVVWNQGGAMVARGALVTAVGPGGIGAFNALQTIPSTGNCSFGDIGVAPSGAVVQVCENPTGGQGPATLRINVDADGLGPGAFAATASTVATNVGGFDFIDPQNSRSVDAEAGLAFDRNPASPHFGRVYLVYSEEPINEGSPSNLNTLLRFSDNTAGTWSAPIKVDDDATTTKAQFLPKIATDRVTGNIAVCWHDARNSASNTAMQIFCSASNGLVATPTFLANVQVSDGASVSNGNGVEFGDYMGLVFGNDVIHPAWADTSNSTGNNPNGTAGFDAFTDRVTGPPFPVALETFTIE